MAIAKMNRVFMIGPSVHKEETVRFLQHAGVIHLEPVLPLAGAGEKEASTALLRLRKLLQIEQAVNRYSTREEKHPVDCPDDELFGCAEDALAALQEIGNRRQALERLANDLAPWGDFDPEVLRHLEEAGVCIRRWRLDRKKDAKLTIPDGILAEIVSEKPATLFYTISLEGTVDIPAASLLPVPEMGLACARKEIERLKTEEESLAGRLAGIALRADVLKVQTVAALNEAHYLEQIGTLYAENYLFGLQGWIPEDMATDFLTNIKKEHIPLQVEIRDPLDDEEPPVLIRNNWFIERIQPLLKLYGNPKYRHLDPSYFFAPFMVLFFGICLSDAGYGLLFYLVAHVLGKKMGEKIEGLDLVVKLCKAFAIASIVIGLATGSIFGYSFENRQWILVDIDVNFGNPMILFYVSLGLGAVHLTLSYLMGILQAAYFYEKMQKLGLIFVLWGGVLLIARGVWFGTPVSALHAPLYYGGVGCLAAGLLLTLLFPNNSKKWAARLGLGLWNIYGLTGLVGDVLSYARLFGLGIATSSIASVMNQLSVMTLESVGPILGLPLALLIIIVGHAFNLALSLLGSTVHSARLHFVEAFKSFFEGGGVEYKPFKIERGSL